jgi:N-methylhydantoinase B
MNNFTLGGSDPRRGGAPFAYYETIAGGMGARPDRDGISGIHTHMTNSWNSPIEVLEHSYPVRVLRYSFRPNSGGAGQYRGGDGLIREVELLTDMQVGLLCDRRARGPYGLAGGDPGKPGRNELLVAGKRRPLAAKCAFYAASGAVVRIESPGGGGWGKPKKRKST